MPEDPPKTLARLTISSFAPMEIDPNLSSVLRNLKVDDPWTPPRTWESIPSESGAPRSGDPRRRSRAPIYDPALVSEYMRGKRVLEINPRHSIIKELRDKVAKDSEDESVKQTARLIYQTALLESGFTFNDPKEFASSIYKSVQKSLDISPDATIEEEDDTEEAEAEEKDTATKGADADSTEEEAEYSSEKDEL